jgi:hypothetical protein
MAHLEPLRALEPSQAPARSLGSPSINEHYVHMLTSPAAGAWSPARLALLALRRRKLVGEEIRAVVVKASGPSRVTRESSYYTPAREVDKEEVARQHGISGS